MTAHTYGKIEYIELNDWGAVEPRWRIQAEPNVHMRLKRIWLRVAQTAKGAIEIGHTPEVARDLEWIGERYPMVMNEAHRRIMEAAAREYTQQQHRIAEILSGQRTIPTGEMVEPAVPPREYQLQAADLLQTTGRLLLGDDLGLGKSFTGLLALRDPEATPALIVCPTHLPPQWLRELHKFFPWLRGHILRKGTPYDISATREMRGHEPHVLISNYHKLAGWANHLAGKIRTVVFDEAQELRRPGSLKYNAAMQIAHKAQTRMGMTATPIYNYGDEVHSIYDVLDPEALGTRQEFLREWGGPSYGQHTSISDPEALGKYLRREGLFLRRTRKDVGRELPPVTRVPHEIELDEAKLAAMSTDAFDLAEMIVTKTGSRQDRFEASGQLEWKMRHATGVAKAPYVAAFTNLLLESQDKVLLFGWHHDVYDIWQQELAEHRPLMYTGQQSAAQKRRTAEAFLNDPKHRVLIMSLRAGAGLDGLQEVAHTLVFGELDWSPGMHDQCIGRLNRDGQTEQVVAYFLTADDGSDPIVADVLNVKRQDSDAIHDPDGAAIRKTDASGERIRKLAAHVYERQAKRRKVHA